MEAYQQLERSWAEFNGLDPAGMVACSSGTAALHLALEAFQLPQGSEVIVPDFTMIACARAVTLAGLTPVFVDCDERLLMEVHQSVIFPLKHKTSAVMAVHVYGRRLDMDYLAGYAGYTGWGKAYAGGWDQVKLIEDLAEAHGIKPHPWTNAACWSFYKNKIVAGEEGGAVWFKDRAHADLARQLRCLGFTEAHDFRHVPRGHNYRMSNLHAEEILGYSERVGRDHFAPYNTLCKYDKSLRKRREIEVWYDLECPDEWRMPPRDAPWVYDIRNPQWAWTGITNVVKALNDAGIRARHSFIPMSRQDEYLDCRLVKREKWDQESELPLVARSWVASTEVLYLPIQPGVTTEEDCRRAFEVLRGIVG